MTDFSKFTVVCSRKDMFDMLYEAKNEEEFIDYAIRWLRANNFNHLKETNIEFMFLNMCIAYRKNKNFKFKKDFDCFYNKETDKWEYKEAE